MPYPRRSDAARGDQILIEALSVQAIQKSAIGTAGADVNPYHSRDSGAKPSHPCCRALWKSLLNRKATRGTVADDSNKPVTTPMKHKPVLPSEVWYVRRNMILNPLKKPNMRIQIKVVQKLSIIRIGSFAVIRKGREMIVPSRLRTCCLLRLASVWYRSFLVISLKCFAFHRNKTGANVSRSVSKISNNTMQAQPTSIFSVHRQLCLVLAPMYPPNTGPIMGPMMLRF